MRTLMTRALVATGVLLAVLAPTTAFAEDNSGFLSLPPEGPYIVAVRLDQTEVVDAAATPPPSTEQITGVHGLPFAPEGLSNCDEMSFYRQQAGLPARFDALGWRESNCRQELGVHTSCCWGYLQLNISLHLRDHRLVERYHDCGVFFRQDADGPEPIEKQRHMCAAKALYDLLGFQPWAL